MQGLVCQACQEIRKNNSLLPFFFFQGALRYDIDHYPRHSKAAVHGIPRGYILYILNCTFEKVVSIELGAASSAPAPSPSFPCQLRSTLVDAQASGPILALAPHRVNDRVLCRSTRLLVPRVKKTPLRGAAGAEQAIWRATRRPR